MKYFIAISLIIATLKTNAQNKADAILGKWESTEKNLIVEVYKQDEKFKAKIVWFLDEVDTSLMNTRLDVKNPDKALRNRKIIGIDVLTNMKYNPNQNKWTGGKIYDSNSGKTWDATVWLINPDLMNVRGFYGIRLLGKTLNFTRIKT
jgi:uncharacterized protein (DUF2147 family)